MPQVSECGDAGSIGPRTRTRRIFLRGVPKGEPMAEDRKVVTAEPENSETPLEGVRSWVTPTRLFFVRNHFPCRRWTSRRGD